MFKRNITSIILATVFMLSVGAAKADILSVDDALINSEVIGEDMHSKQDEAAPSKKGLFNWFKKKPTDSLPTVEGDKDNACRIEEPCENEAKPLKMNYDKTNEEAFVPVNNLSGDEMIKDDEQNDNTKKLTLKKQKVEKFDIEIYLMLSDEQIQQAKDNRIDGEARIKPIMDEIKIIETKVDLIKRKNAPGEARAKQLERYEIEIRQLKSQANEVRKENVESFEHMLTPEQKQLFDDIKRINISPVIKNKNSL